MGGLSFLNSRVCRDGRIAVVAYNIVVLPCVIPYKVIEEL